MCAFLRLRKPLPHRRAPILALIFRLLLLPLLLRRFLTREASRQSLHIRMSVRSMPKVHGSKLLHLFLRREWALPEKF